MRSETKASLRESISCSTFTIEEICPVDVTYLLKWIEAIPFADWPQQAPLDDGQLRPAMITSWTWRGFNVVATPIWLRLTHPIATLCGCLPHFYQPMLSVVMPGHCIEPHRDQQPDYWFTRIHVPLTTNARAVTVMADGDHQMEVGNAYAMNVRGMHAVENLGDTPRIHFMFDVRKTDA